MTTTPFPLADPPRPTARPPSHRDSEDHEPHLSGGARYASAYRMPTRANRLELRRDDRARSLPVVGHNHQRRSR
jgi:hypothetical protein